MTRCLLALAGLAAILAGCGGSSGVVPQAVEHHIAKAFPGIAYIPARLPAGYHYYSDRIAQDGFDLWFSQSGSAGGLGFHVREGHCGTAHMHTFTVNGARVFWTGTYEDQRAFRCFSTARSSFGISATRSIAGDSSLTPPNRLHDALLLARLVADARRVG